MSDSILLALTTTLSFALTGVVLLRNVHDGRNRALALFMFSLILWDVLNFASDNSQKYYQIFTQLTFASMALVGISIVLLSAYFPTKKWVLSRKVAIIYSCTALVVGVLSLTPLLVKNVIKTENGLNIQVGILYYPYLVYILGSVVFAIRNFNQQHKISNVLEKKQLRLVVTGFVLLALSGTVFQLVLPAVVNNWSSSKYGPIFITLFIAYLSIAIIRHKLFDIRSFVFRAAVYLLSIGLVGVIYTGLIFVVGSTLIDIKSINTNQRIFFALLTLLIAFTYSPIVKFFNKITSKLFFRDAYDSQRVLDQVSNIIVGNVDPHKIQKGALSALADALKPAYMIFLFTDNTSGKLHTGDLVGQKWSIHNPNSLQEVLKKIRKKIVVHDELEEQNSMLGEVLRIEDISVVAPLVTKEEKIGYLILGAKKSGNIYNSQDIGLLNIATNELAVALQNAQRFEEIQAFNITLQEKVTEATHELKSTNKKLVALDEAKDEFISMASHQLRTPLTSIKGYLSMIIEGDLGKVTTAQEKALKEAFGSSQRMVYLIADFLNVSRIKTGKFLIEPKEVDLPEIVREEITQLREMAGARDLTLEYEQPEVFPRVMLDDNKIRQVMMNMVDNAIYYTPTGGKITIQLYSTGSEIIFKVVDTGIGVPKHEQHKLFTKFYRAGNARKARPDGTGLGLFMAQKIVAEQGGAIIFESQEGKGSTFGWRFPLARIKV